MIISVKTAISNPFTLLSMHTLGVYIYTPSEVPPEQVKCLLVEGRMDPSVWRRRGVGKALGPG